MFPMLSTKARSRTGSVSHAETFSGSTRGLSTTNAKQLSNGFRLFNKQSMPNLSSKPSAVERPYFPDEMVAFDQLRGIIKPCPFFEPLKFKLEAREEPSAFYQPELDTDSEHSISVITIARRRGETIKKLNGQSSDENLTNIQERPGQSTAFFEQLAHSLARNSIVKVEEIAEVAFKMSPEPSMASMWSYYISCYAKGQYNILAPPDPPAWGPNYEYLPAVNLPNEDQRMALSATFDILWPSWTREMSGPLLLAAMERFDTPFASFSFFNRSNELFKAENGFNQPEIERQMSIAAHVLYTNEVMVLLDTHKDWRFARNPLVRGMPCIRFFAGAPLLSTSGLVMGVFAVWSKEPRDSFGPEERRELAEFSALLVTELSLQVKRLAEPEPRAVPRRECYNPTYGLSRRCSSEVSLIDLDAATNFELGLVPPALRYHRSISRPLSRVYTGGSLTQGDYRRSHTPPPSRQNRAVEGETADFAELNSSSIIPDSSFPGMALFPTFGEIQESNSRPFSSSDLTSLPLLPPNTPDQSLTDDELSHHPYFDLDQFPSMQDLHEFENSQDFSTASDIVATSRNTGDETLARTSAHFRPVSASAEDDPLGCEESSDNDGSIVLRPVVHRYTPEMPFQSAASSSHDTYELLPAMKTGSAHHSKPSMRCSEIPSNDCYGISPSWESSEAAKHAAMICSDFARKMSYDLIYVAEIRPAQSGMPDKALLRPGGMTKRILVAYGLTQPLDLSSETHLRILRCKESEHWSKMDGNRSKQHYAHGCLISIIADVSIPRELRDSGLVMGVFSWKPMKKKLSKNEEMQEIMEFSRELKHLLLKIPEGQPVRRLTTKPASAKTNRYLANEATELQLDDDSHYFSNRSRDPRPKRRYM